MKHVEWTDTAIRGLAKLDKDSARRIRQALERFAKTTAGDVKKLQGIDPPEYRLRVGDYRVRFDQDKRTIRVLRIRNRKEACR